MNSFSSTNTSAGYQPDRHIHPCPHCPLMLASPPNVEQHCREQHEYTGVHCPQCSKEFSRNWLMYRHMNHVHGINIHPGQGRQQRGVRRRRQPKRTVGRRGPVATRPQATQPLLTSQPLRGAQFSRGVQVLQASRVITAPYIIPDDPEAFGNLIGVGQEFETSGYDQTVAVAERYIIIDTDLEKQEEADLGVQAFDRFRGAEQAFELPTYDKMVAAGLVEDKLLCTADIFCPDKFDHQEALLTHMHLVHGMPYSEHCECIECFLKNISGEFTQTGGEAQVFGEVGLSQTTTPVAGLETYAAGIETDVGNDSGIDGASVDSPSIQQPLSHNTEPINQLNTNKEASTSIFARRIASDQKQGSLEAGEMHAAFDSTNFHLDFLDGDPLKWLNEEAMAGLIGEWDNETKPY